MATDDASATKIVAEFKSTPAEALLRIDEGQGYVVEEPIVQIKHTDTVEHALALLAKFKISSLPVYHEGRKRHLGFVDRLDFVAFILSKLADVDHPSADQIDAIAAQAMTEQVKDVIDMSRWDPFVMVKRGTPMLNVLEQFAQGVHRVALHDHDDSSRITGVVSQSAFLRWVLPRLNRMGEPVNRTLQDLGQLGFGEVLTVKETDTALLALRRIGLFRVSAAAVVNDEGKIVESFSATDTNGLLVEPFSSLLLPVRDFLRPLRRRHIPVAITGPVTCSPISTLAEVATLMGTCHVHRVWIVDSNGGPLGVVTISDVVHAFINRLGTS